MNAPEELHATFDLALEVARVLRKEGIEPLIIGAVALAAHHYPRYTKDLDLGVAVPPSRLGPLCETLKERGLDVELRVADAADPLGGVIVVNRPGAFCVEVVNFDNAPAGGFPALVRDAAQAAQILDVEVPLLVVGVVDLILFKLYAGGAKSTLDILELLVRNPVALDELTTRCRQYRLTRQLDAILATVTRR